MDPDDQEASTGTISGLSPFALTLLLTALGAALRFSALAAQSFWYDEAVSVNLARHTLGEILSGRARDLGNPPLYPALLHIWMAVFGSSDGAVRGLSALLGTLTIPVVVTLAREVFPARVAFLGGTLLAVSPFHLQMAQEARAYTLLALLGAVTCLALVRATQAPRRWGPWLVLAVATAALVLTHYFGVFLALAQVAYLLLEHRRERGVLLRALGAYAAAALLFSFWLPAFFSQLGVSGNLARSADSWYLHLAATPLVFGVGTSLVWKDSATAWRLVLGGLAALAFVGSVAVGLHRSVVRPQGGRNPRVLLLLAWLALPVLLPALLSLVTPLYNTRYVIAASLPFLLFAAAGLYEIPARARPVLAAVMVLTMGTATLTYSRGIVKHQWREAAAFVEAVRKPGDLVLFDADYNETAYAHYAGPNPGARVRLLAPERGPDDHLWGAKDAGADPSDMTTAIAAAPRVWLILADAHRDGEDRARAFFASHRFAPGAETNLRGITIQAFDKKP